MNALVRHTMLVVPLLTLVASGCQDEYSRCEASVEPTCDLGDSSCHRVLSEHVACIRDIDPPPAPTIEVLSQGSFRERYPTSPAAWGDFESCLELFSLENPSFALADEDAVPSVTYDSERQVIIVTDPEERRGLLRAVALAQLDREIGGLASITATGRTFDAVVALNAHIFGQALFFGDVAWWKTEPLYADEMADFIRSNIYYLDEIRDLLWLARRHSFPLRYPLSYASFYGAHHTLDGWIQEPRAATSWGEISTTADLILGRPTTSVPREMTFEGPILDGFEPLWSDSLGALSVHAALTRLDRQTPTDNYILEDRDAIAALAESYAGDLVTCLYNPEKDEYYGLWVIERVSADDLPYLIPPFGYFTDAIVTEARVILIGAISPDTRAELRALLTSD